MWLNLKDKKKTWALRVPGQRAGAIFVDTPSGEELSGVAIIFLGFYT